MDLNAIMGPEMLLDLDRLKGADPIIFVKLLSDNKKTITQRINETAKTYLLLGEMDDGANDPAFAVDPDFKARWFSCWYQALRGRVCRSSSQGSVISLILPTAVYLYDSYGLSCSKLLLGREAKTIPPLWLRNWLAQATKLSNDDLAQLFNILEDGRRVRCDTVYVLKSRILELAAERGLLEDDFFLYPGILNSDLRLMAAFQKTPFQEECNDYETMKPFLGTNKLIRLIVAMSVVYGCTPDYLLLQDYSEFAMMPDGRVYSPTSRQLMSLLLNADAATRADAIGYVLAATTINSLNGKPIPSEKTNSDIQQEPFDIMDTFAKSTMQISRLQAEKRIIETLKPKLLEILELSNAPVSSAKLFDVISGSCRLARSALTSLEKEGKVVRIPTKTGVYFWQYKKH